MPKIPRDLSGKTLVELLDRKYGYKITRQAGSHLRLTGRFTGAEHHITIPNHSPLKIGTLNKILKELSIYLKEDKESVAVTLFKE